MKRWMQGVNPLAMLAGLIMIVSLLFPWWSFQLEYAEQSDLYPYMLDGPASEMVGYKRSPQMELLTGVFVVCIGLCLVGSFIKGRLARIMLFLSGALVFLGVWRLLARIADVAARFTLPIQGHGRASYGPFVQVYAATWLRPGVYIIILAAVLALVAALLHKKLWLQFES